MHADGRWGIAEGGVGGHVDSKLDRHLGEMNDFALIHLDRLHRGHLLAIDAKQLLQGQKLVIVRIEECNISGSLIRNKLKWLRFKRKRLSTNPKRGPFHQRAPAKMFFRVVRGMVPHKTTRGELALTRLKVFEGIPSPYDRLKRMVIPSALKAVRIKPGRNFCILGELCTHAGWKHYQLIKNLEETRKVKSKEFYVAKKAGIKAFSDTAVTKASQLAGVNAKLAEFGY